MKPDIPFEPLPKTHRLERDIVITEKIDGATAGIYCEPFLDNPNVVEFVHAASRKRWIEPEEDNYGFAAWVEKNAGTLANDLGVGMHFGEWWGSGIRRGYGLTNGEKRFSLFNTRLWGPKVEEHEETTVTIDHHFDTLGVASTPILYEGPFTFKTGLGEVHMILPWVEAARLLERDGSVASPGFMDPEGVVIFHKAAQVCFKWTLDGDRHKG